MTAIMPVERGKIREYAIATGSSRPEYLGDPQAPIPPTFLSTVVFWESLEGVFALPEAAEALRDVGIAANVRRLLSLEQEYVFHGSLPRAGDTLLTNLRFDGAEPKEGKRGRMVLVRFTVEFHGEGKLRAECRYTSAFVAAA
jgi:hypothetical protein